MITSTGRPRSNSAAGPSEARIRRSTSSPAASGQREVEQQRVGLAEAAEAQRVGGRRRRQRVVAVRLEVLDQQLAGELVVLADDDRSEVIQLRQHLRLLALIGRVHFREPRSRSQRAPGGQLEHRGGAAAPRRSGAAGTTRIDAGSARRRHRGRRGRARNACRTCGRSCSAAAAARCRLARDRDGRARAAARAGRRRPGPGARAPRRRGSRRRRRAQISGRRR